MEGSEKEKLLAEYIERIVNRIHWPLRLMGFGRFDIRNGEIVDKSLSSIFKTMFLLMVVLFCAFYTIYAESYKTKYLTTTEVLLIIDMAAFTTSVFSNISFINRSSTAQFINASIDVDIFLGAKPTIFLRDVAAYTFNALCAFLAIFQFVLMFVLFFSYNVDITVYIVGFFLFNIQYFIYYDNSFFLWLYTHLTLRVRYLNVAIMKLAHVKPEYLPDQFPFNAIIWTKEMNNLVDFHERAELADYTKAFMMLYRQLRYLESCYRFTIFCCIMCASAGTFLMVQSCIEYVKSTDGDIIRVLAVIGWCILCWTFLFGICQQTDMFARQINQTNLICTYIQLKPSYPDEIYKLTASILRTLEVRDCRISIYNMFYFDTAQLLRLASSIFLYITMQLQIAFPGNTDVVILDNVITSAE